MSLTISNETILARIDAFAAEMKDFRKAVAAALKTPKKGSKPVKGSDASSTGSGGSATPRTPTSWQAWGKFLLPEKGENSERAAAYTLFKEGYTHPTNGSKQGVMVAYLQYRAFVGGSKEGGMLPEYEAFLASHKMTSAKTPAKATVVVAAPAAPMKAAVVVAAGAAVAVATGAASAAAESHEEVARALSFGSSSSSSSSSSMSGPPLPRQPSSGLARSMTTVLDTAELVGAAAAAGAAGAAGAAMLLEPKPKVAKVVKKVVKKAAAGGAGAAAAAVTTVATKAAEPWSWNGRTNLVKNASNEVWASTDDGLEWVGLYDPAEDTMDEMVDEPTRA